MLLAHYREHGARDVECTEEVDLNLRPELLRANFLEEAGLEAGGVIDQHVDPAEPLDRCLYGRLGIGRAGDVQLDNQQVIGLADGFADYVRIATRGHNGVSGGESGPGDVHTHAAPRARNKPHLLHRHVTSVRRG